MVQCTLSTLHTAPSAPVHTPASVEGTAAAAHAAWQRPRSVHCRVHCPHCPSLPCSSPQCAAHCTECPWRSLRPPLRPCSPLHSQFGCLWCTARCSNTAAVPCAAPHCTVVQTALPLVLQALVAASSEASPLGRACRRATRGPCALQLHCCSVLYCTVSALQCICTAPSAFSALGSLC